VQLLLGSVQSIRKVRLDWTRPGRCQSGPIPTCVDSGFSPKGLLAAGKDCKPLEWPRSYCEAIVAAGMGWRAVANGC